MGSRVAFAVFFLFFHLLGAAYYVTAPTAYVGTLFWSAFLVLGIAAARKAYDCQARKAPADAVAG